MKTKDLIEVLRNLSIIQELAEKTKHGFVPFSKYHEVIPFEGIIYDDVKFRNYEQPVFNAETDVSRKGYPIVYNYYATDDLHEICSVYDSECAFDVVLWITEKKDGLKEYYIECQEKYEENPESIIIIEDGEWYVS